MVFIIIGIVVLIIIAIVYSKRGVIPPPVPPPTPPEPVPDPDPHYWKWRLVDETTERWKSYCDYMKRITSDTLLALELQKKVLIDGVWKRFYRWVSDWDLFHVLDRWDLPDEVFERGTCDCDGFARLTSDVLGRFVKYSDVHWVEYYGFYRKYYYNEQDGEWYYKVVAGGHAITVYTKNEELKAFSNTSWWDKNFRGFIDVGEETFPEGLYWVISRHWCNGKMEWQKRSKEGEILEGTNIFHRRLRLIRNLEHLKRGERKKCQQEFISTKHYQKKQK